MRTDQDGADHQRTTAIAPDASTSPVGHTPGPWHLCQHLLSVEDDAACGCGYRGVVFGPDPDVAMAICQPGHERPRREEEWGSEPCRYPRAVEIANARLIAAAPELLEALEQVVKNLGATEKNDGHKDIWRGAFDAIAKARGEVA